jgi:DmsE family decaheme c-type cytochrome
MRARCERKRSLPVWLAAGALLAPAPGAAAAIGDECASCHADEVAGLAASAHGRAFALDKSYAGASCSSCHGPGQAHVDAGGDAALIRNPATLSAEATNAACMSCHDERRGHAFWEGSAHESAAISCAACHDIHGAGHAETGAVQAVRTTELCLSCHTGHRKGLYQRSSHPLRDGPMECTSCHDPHGTSGEHLIDQDSVNDLCFTCHQSMRGPFLWEHSPVREDCLTCHAPHGSNHDKMLVARPAQLCQSCHLQGRHQTVAGLDTAMWNTNRQCLNCHTQIHGSNHPSGPLFQR